jgi:hypothetical protein
MMKVHIGIIGKVEMVKPEAGPILTWEDFMEYRDWEDEDSLWVIDRFDNYQILQGYVDLDLDDMVNVDDINLLLTVEDLQKYKPIFLESFVKENCELIEDATRFFGNRFSIDFGIYSY